MLRVEGLFYVTNLIANGIESQLEMEIQEDLLQII